MCFARLSKKSVPFVAILPYPIDILTAKSALTPGGLAYLVRFSAILQENAQNGTSFRFCDAPFAIHNIKTAN
jgi:hypothetical protein